MPDDLLDFSDTSSSKQKGSSRSSVDHNPSHLDDPDVYCSVASGDFEDSESLKQQLLVVEAELKAQVDRNLALTQSLDRSRSAQKDMEKDFEAEKSRLVSVSDALRSEIEDLKSRIPDRNSTEPSEHTQDSDSVKKQFDMKLKDVMEKAREHAKKIATERDDFRKQAEEKEAKLIQFKQLMNEAKASLESKDSDIREVRIEADKWRSKCENLNLQLSNMESHYTTPPEVNDSSSIRLRVMDDEENEWILVESSVEKSWWRRTAFGDLHTALLESVPLLSMAEIGKLKHIQDTMKSELVKKCSEFDEYKKRAESLLTSSHSAMSEPPSSTITPPDMDSVRKLMKAEEEVSKLSANVTKLGKRIAQLEATEKTLRTELDEKDALWETAKRDKEEILRRVKEIEIEKQKLSLELQTRDKTITDLRAKIRDLNAEKAVESLVVAPFPQSPSKSSSSAKSAAAAPAVPISKPPPVFINMSSQTIDQPVTVNVSGNLQASTSYHDSVVIPLRTQIRTLIEDIESEKHQHDLTKQQLNLVKEELRKVESDRSFVCDLSDSTKVEYMRNVGRKFFLLMPHHVSEELEQMLPVMLSLFQISPEEISRLLAERRRNRPDPPGLMNSISIPKLW